jgi:hypothetical protein
VRIKHELAQLGARGAAVAAEQQDQGLACVGRNREARGAQLVVDQPRDVARGVGIAGDRDRGLGALAHIAQRGAAA